jgi:hypothetical protein
MNIGQNIQQAKRGMVPNATIVAQEISGNMVMSLVKTPKGIINVISAIRFCTGREKYPKLRLLRNVHNSNQFYKNLELIYFASLMVPTKNW